MTKEIPLTQGKVAIVDDHQYERVMQFKWCAQYAHGLWYAHRKTSRANGAKSRVVQLHRFITNAPAGMEVDHKNGNGLDCTDDNMRLCTHAENQRNTKKPSTNTSGYKGVSWHKTSGKMTGKWVAQIGINRQNVYIGLFSDPIDAALAYDAKARELHGEFARTNFPLPTT